MNDSGRGRILIVDDAISNVEILILGLTSHGYQVETANSGKRALGAALQSAPDLILLDIRMPDMDGYEVCRQLKNEPRLRDIPVIFVSALQKTIEKVKGFEVGGIDYLTKPFEFEEVLVHVETHLTLHRQRKQIEQLLVQRELIEAAQREQHAVVGTLLNSAIALSSTLQLEEVLERILRGVRQVVKHDLAMIVLIEGEEAWVASLYRQPPVDSPVPTPRVSVQGIATLTAMRETRQCCIIADTQTNPLGIQWEGFEGLHSFIGAPIFADDEMIGVLCLKAQAPGFYTEDLSQRLQAFAVLAALAIKNARLYESAQELAMFQERQRLARELHDSVSQTLFSANAMAQALEHTVDLGSDKARRYVAELAQFTREAMGEMRALLFEFRPETLTRTQLGALLKQLCDPFTLKTQIAVSLDALEGILLPEKEQMVFYRVAQEALNNIAKHARATQVQVDLRRRTDGLILCIQDNGRGFDPQHIPADHLGVRIMRERADSIGAELIISSQEGQGTAITLRG
jgi:signal transduction histidine kinase